MDTTPTSILITKEFKIKDNFELKTVCKIEITFRNESEILNSTQLLKQVWLDGEHKIIKQFAPKTPKKKKHTLIYQFDPHQNNQEVFPQKDLFNWSGIFEVFSGNKKICKKLIQTFRLPSNPIIQGDCIKYLH